MGGFWARIMGRLRRLLGAGKATVKLTEAPSMIPLQNQSAAPSVAPKENQTVLIGTLRDANQFSACIHNTFYYIPAYLVPEEALPIHYVALFRTPHVFGKFSGVYCYGEVIACKRVLRKEISEVPLRHINSSEVPYFRFSIAAWTPLERPIPPGDTGFVCAFTTQSALLEAQETSEFLLDTAERKDYRQLKDAASHRGSLELPGCMGDDLTARIGKGKIKICRDDRMLAQCDIQAFSQRPYTAFRNLQQQIM